MGKVADPLREYIAKTWDGSMYVNQVPLGLLKIADQIDREHDHELEQRMREQYSRGYEDGRRSMDAERYHLKLKLQDLTFDGGSHDNLSKIAYAIYPCATGWTCESSEGLRDELVRLLGGVGKPSGGFAKSADFGKSESVGNDEVGKGCQIHQITTTYDVLGNERHKAVCRLREWEPDEDGMPHRELWEAIMGEKLPTVPLKGDAELDIIMRDRLIHLLGGDECNFSGVESYMDAMGKKSNPAETSDGSTDHVTSTTHSPENGTCHNDDKTCPNPVQGASITDEFGNERHKAIAELRRISIDALCDEYDYVEVYPEFMWAVGQAIGLSNGAGFEDIVSRLTYLLGGDEPSCGSLATELSQASVKAMSRRADQSHDSSPMSLENETTITDELRKFVAETWDGSMYVNQIPKNLQAIADRIDEQFERICWQHEAVLQSTIERMADENLTVKDERDYLRRQRDELQAKLDAMREVLDGEP